MFIFEPSFRYNLLISSSGGDGYCKNCLKYLPARIKNTISSKNYTAKNIKIILKLLSLFISVWPVFCSGWLHCGAATEGVLAADLLWQKA